MLGRLRPIVDVSQELQELSELLSQAMPADRAALERRLRGLRRRRAEGKPIDRGLTEVRAALLASVERRRQRLERLPRPRYPEELPVSARREEIAAAVAEHQVVVVAGETGSGKTTQLPKICLEIGRGVAGLIGHTQPRRIAARSVATRIAAELDTTVGHAVGYKIRFADRVSSHSYIKLMTDGILLAEMQSDPRLEQYDTLIIDEAHERSLNIDFLLGYLRQLLPQRPDLKVIITSATIDTERFARHFDAPVIEVCGRTYPVTVHYRPLLAADEDERDRDLTEAICDAVAEATALDPQGDILVFLPGEREIRESAEALRKRPLRHTEILPLYARLSAAEQNRVFQSHPGRRIVLATNVAETSLTVPGIRFVIDSGLARISRYSHRTKVQRLPIEPISQASANQRAGRCGRVAPGVCFRLYEESDFLGRPQFTEPEIRRTNLASVILQMKVWGLGDVENFPFIDPPDRRFISDGYRLLHELGAVDERRMLTPIGKQLARFPVDPRIGRMLLAASKEGALHEVLIIAAALSIQDPRERPLEAQQQADEKHRQFREESSDFLGFLKLWESYHEQARHLSGSKLRAWCRENFLSFVRMREWHDIHGQLASVAGEMGLRVNTEPAEYAAVHRALLTGLLSHIALKSDSEAPHPKGRPKRLGADYTGARGTRLALFPGSALFKTRPKWVVAAELVETGRLYARIVARIEPAWLEELAAHLVKRGYFEPHWEKRAARVAAFEQVTLFGLIVVARRRVDYSTIDPALARELFIRHALVLGEYNGRAPFLEHNRALLAEVEALEAKLRRRDLLVDEQTLFACYDAILPEGICSGAHFERWRREAERANPKLLFLTREQVMRRAEMGAQVQFPERLEIGGVQVPLQYHFEPGHPADGVTACIPLAALNQLPAAAFEWLVPGLLEEKVAALIRSLPKALRRHFVPVPDFAAAALDALAAGEGNLHSALGAQLRRMTGVEVPEAEWHPQALPPHLRMNFRVLDAAGKVVGEGRDLRALQEQLGGQAQASLREMPREAGVERSGLQRWDFESLPEALEVKRGGSSFRLYPALTDEGESAAIRLFDTPEKAEAAMRAGTRRLFLLENAAAVRYLRKNLPGLKTLCLFYAPLGACADLTEAMVLAVADSCLFDGESAAPRSAGAFKARSEAARRKLAEAGNALAAALREGLECHQQIRRQLDGKSPAAWSAALEDVRDQLDRLVYPGFVLATPYHRLLDLPRYLKAILLRLEKLPRAVERDRQNTAAIAPLWRDCFEALASGAVDGELADYRWQLEELRVSLYAQELKAAGPVSVQRLQRQWQRLTERLRSA